MTRYLDKAVEKLYEKVLEVIRKSEPTEAAQAVVVKNSVALMAEMDKEESLQGRIADSNDGYTNTGGLKVILISVEPEGNRVLVRM